MQAHGAEIAYLFNLLAEIGGRRMFSHAKRRPASEPRGDGYSKFSSLRNREIEIETLIFAPISLSYIETD